MNPRALRALLLFSALSGTGTALADAHAEVATEPALHAALFPDAYAAQAARDEASAAEFSRLFRALPGVRESHVGFQRVHPADVPLDQALPAPHLVIVLQTEGPGPTPDALEQALRVVRDRANGATTQVIQAPATQPVESPAPSADDKRTVILRTLLALSLAANVLLATVLLVRLRFRVG